MRIYHHPQERLETTHEESTSSREEASVEAMLLEDISANISTNYIHSPDSNAGALGQLRHNEEQPPQSEPPCESDTSAESTDQHQPSVAQDFIQDLFPNAGRIVKQEQPRWRTIIENQYRDGNGNLYHPFLSSSDWDLARWMHATQLTMADVNEYFKMPMTKEQQHSFRNGATLHSQIERLPDPGARWCAKTILLESGKAGEDVTLFYRNPVEVVEELLSRPHLAKEMEFIPMRVWTDQQRTRRVYSEVFTGDWTWRLQESLPTGATLIPIILGSDKTHLTQLGGNKHAWPVYLTIGNIQSQTRNKLSNRTWIPVAYIPTPSFLDPTEIHSTLQARLYHQCLRIVFAPLYRLGNSGIPLTDSRGDVRDCYLRIAIHQADLPEQNMINIAPHNLSPNTVTTREELGNGSQKPLRTRQWICDRIKEVTALVDPSDILAYQESARKHGLSGVTRPFWESLPDFRPELCCAPDILHGILRFWRDHVLKWIIRLIGRKELNRRLAVLQPIISIRNFRNGINKLPQWTGKEDRELLRVTLAVIAGHPAATRSIMECLRAIHDFIYLAQFRMHSTETLQDLSESLATFHRLKGVLLDVRARCGKKKKTRLDHFRIPKLEPLRMYEDHIKEMGTSPQFSTESVESCHKAMAKQPYKMTNRRNVQEQICRYLDRVDRIAHLEEILKWYHLNERNRIVNAELEKYSSEYQDLARKYISAAETSWHRRHARVDRITCNLVPNLRHRKVSQVAHTYHLLDLAAAINRFHPNSATFPSQHLDVWYRMRIRTPSVQDDNEPDQVRTVMALPPAYRLPYGLCNHVFVHVGPEAKTTGVEVPLAYVQWYTPPSQKDKNLRMYVVKPVLSNGNRQGDIVKLESIARLVQLVPKFGKYMDPKLTMANSADVCQAYYLNDFADRQLYQVIH
ncbi:hypothetical protein FRC17_000651 [Serendipita sp. 399]|nr:hypothetical protein FRC17_000651 [Serendipita sp. 399]